MPAAQGYTTRIRASLLARKRAREITTARIDDLALLLLVDLVSASIDTRLAHVWVETGVFARCQSHAAELAVTRAHLLAVLHQPLELGERLLDLGDGTRAVDELALVGVELRVRSKAKLANPPACTRR